MTEGTATGISHGTSPSRVTTRRSAIRGLGLWKYFFHCNFPAPLPRPPYPGLPACSIPPTPLPCSIRG